MSDEPHFEIFIPQSRSPSSSQEDDQPPNLPEEISNLSGPQNGIINDPTRAANTTIFSRPFWPWPNRGPQYLYHPNWMVYPQPYPPHLPPSMEINPQLFFNFRNPGHPYLYWDIAHPPKRYARLYDRYFFFKRSIKANLDELAIRPAVKKAWITSDHPVLGYWVGQWGPIVVKSENLLVEDILDGIFEYLRTPLTPAELSQIGSVPGNRQALEYARAQRAKTDDNEVAIFARGYERIDVIGGHRRFQGLQFEYLPNRTWRLRLSLLPGTLTKIR